MERRTTLLDAASFLLRRRHPALRCGKSMVDCESCSRVWNGYEIYTKFRTLEREPIREHRRKEPFTDLASTFKQAYSSRRGPEFFSEKRFEMIPVSSQKLEKVPVRNSIHPLRGASLGASAAVRTECCSQQSLCVLVLNNILN